MGGMVVELYWIEPRGARRCFMNILFETYLARKRRSYFIMLGVCVDSFSFLLPLSMHNVRFGTTLVM